MMNESSAVERVNANPNDISALRFLADLALAQKEYNYAVNFLTRIVRQGPDAEAFFKLGEIFRALQKPIALVYYQRTLELRKDGPDSDLAKLVAAHKDAFLAANPKVRAMLDHVRKGPANPRQLVELNRYLQVIKTNDFKAAYKIGLALHKRRLLDPKMLQTWGTAAARNGDIQTGLEAALLGVWFEPTNWVAVVNLTDIFIGLHQPAHALDFAVAAVNLAPNNPTTWTDLGAANDIAQRPWECELASRRALALDENNAAAWTNLGNALKNSARVEESVPAYARAMKLVTKNPMFRSNYLFGIQYADNMSPDEVARDHFKFGELFEKPLPETRFPRERYDGAKQRLRVGFVSTDFRSHPVSYFVEPLWSNLDPARVEVFAYYTFKRSDIVTERLKKLVPNWRDVSELTMDALYAQVLADKIDILIDMTGHTAGNRLLLFARRAAPVQATWLGHPNTTGLKRIDWRIADPWSYPPGIDAYYSERLLRIPVSAAYVPLCRHPERRGSKDYDVADTPALTNGHVTFGSCNNVAKLSDRCVNTWANLLRLLPSSRLLLESPGLNQNELRGMVLSRFSTRGVVADRISCHDREGVHQYKRYNGIDIALDPFPYNGGTTSFDTVWMGVPLVSLAGNTCISRMGVAIANTVGHPEWVAADETAYVQLALRLASDIGGLKQVRHGLRKEMEQSLLMDGTAFAQSFADALAQMWAMKCEELTKS